MGFKYIIEHMEEDDEMSKTIPPWVALEYEHMRALAGQGGEVHFTHLSARSCEWLSKKFEESTVDSADGVADPDPVRSVVDGSLSLARAVVHQRGVMELLGSQGSSVNVGTTIERVCLLDPKAEKELAPEDGDGRFDCFLFGGILGDDPPRDRTSELRVLGFPSRRLGPVQMTTDTALGVTKLVVQDGIPLDEIKYIDYPTIRFNAKESVEMPFRYIADGAEPLLPRGMKELLHDDLNKSFDF
ncbi:hypothetical protein AMATHDRAFT_65865 [Amanita thiersii Skay4041]|uniref:DUF431-domain-containing protein n=1 Tax=Amanita thiersii Skay4041 TaxID=703135 RepID=A0A2A9NJ59_9AGAR|nr:hypothetical protein AMATHDRAFT_65865 [Amanita thiersii Skay4041]